MLLALKLNVIIVIRNRKTRNLNLNEAYYGHISYARMVGPWAVSLTFFLCVPLFADFSQSARVILISKENHTVKVSNLLDNYTNMLDYFH